MFRETKFYIECVSDPNLGTSCVTKPEPTTNVFDKTAANNYWAT